MLLLVSNRMASCTKGSPESAAALAWAGGAIEQLIDRSASAANDALLHEQRSAIAEAASDLNFILFLSLEVYFTRTVSPFTFRRISPFSAMQPARFWPASSPAKRRNS